MKEAIENRLKVLLGLPLWDAGRTVSLVWFDFGKRSVKIPIEKVKQSFWVNTQLTRSSAWHIRGRKGIVVGSADRFYAGGRNPYKAFEDIDWEDKPGENRCDERLEKFIKQHKKTSLVVVSVEANDWGGLIINLSGGFAIEIFQHDTIGDEYWRMFASVDKGNKHFVVNRNGIG